MTEEHKQNIFKVIDAARKAAEEFPEKVGTSLLNFTVQTPMGLVSCGKLDLWLNKVPLVNLTGKPEFWQPVQDLHARLEEIWLACRCAEAMKRSTADLNRMHAPDTPEHSHPPSDPHLSALPISTTFTAPDHYSACKDSYYESLKEEEGEKNG